MINKIGSRDPISGNPCGNTPLCENTPLISRAGLLRILVGCDNYLTIPGSDFFTRLRRNFDLLLKGF